MPRSQVLPQGRGRVNQVYSAPPPIGGLNLVDALANMAETDALVCENYVPRGQSLELRRGYAQHATGLGGPVESVMAYNGSIPAIFAAATSNFFDVTASGAVGAAVVTGLSNARWEHINVGTAGGQYLYCVNGINSPELWNGTVWQAVTGASSPIAVTGVTTSNLAHILLHQNRVWFIEKDTLKAWYLGINSIGGVATQFDLRTVAKLGGRLVAFDTWTIDSGAGSDDLIAFITSEGEVLVYQGTDPSSTDTWGLEGIYRIGRPAGKRCSLKIGGDLMLLGEGGIIPASTLVQSGIDRSSYVTYKIQPELVKLLSSGLGNYGWEMLYFQSESLGILNVPESTAVTRQYVFDVTTKAWCKWTGIFALSFEMFGGVPYIGQNGVVSKLWTVASDNGAAITGKIKPAFSKYRYAQRKNERRIKIYFSSDAGPIKFGVSINRDFENSEPAPSLTSPTAGVALWDEALWDVATWGGAVGGGTSEIATNVIGTYLSPYVVTQTKNADVRLNGFDHVFEKGGFS